MDALYDAFGINEGDPMCLPLAEDPLPRGARKLSGYDDVFRIRVGHCRILYSVSGGVLVVVFLKIAHPRDVYR